MTKKILIADNSLHDLRRLGSLIKDAGLDDVHCLSGAEVTQFLENDSKDLAAIILLWELPGPPFGPELLAFSRRVLPAVPVIVVSSALDASLATRAFQLGARDFLEKPVDAQRIKECLNSLLKEENLVSPLVEMLNANILGNSSALVSTLRHIARVIEHKASRILLIGESGTGKELLAQSIHGLGADSGTPFVAINVAAIPKDLIESEIFGHEKGAFTGASETHRGYMEEAGNGTLFLDEIGELDLSLQVKLLRALQEKRFRRLKSTKEIKFQARVISATNCDLAQAVQRGSFRPDLFHRLNEVTIQIPPLRDRVGDIEVLLNHFLLTYGGSRTLSFARETMSILRSYPFPGNIRELENFVKSAIIECDGDQVLPQHLPLSMMGDFLTLPIKFDQFDDHMSERSLRVGDETTNEFSELFDELRQALPSNWRDLPYRQALEYFTRAFDRVYYPNIIKRHQHNLTRATKAAGVDKKTFAQHWKNAGLPSMRGQGENSGE